MAALQFDSTGANECAEKPNDKITLERRDTSWQKTIACQRLPRYEKSGSSFGVILQVQTLDLKKHITKTCVAPRRVSTDCCDSMGEPGTTAGNFLT